jgi:hypothetical protein
MKHKEMYKISRSKNIADISNRRYFEIIPIGNNIKYYILDDTDRNIVITYTLYTYIEPITSSLLKPPIT